MALLSGCGSWLEMQVGSVKGTGTGMQKEAETGQYEMTQKDYNTAQEGAEEIDLDSLEEGTGGGYTYDGRWVIISREGTYLIKGKMNHGGLRVNVFPDEVVHLILDNVDISSDTGSAIYVEDAAKVIITSKEGTENILSDAAPRRKEEKACVFSNSDLTVNGGGRLAVYGYHSDAVRSRDQIKIVNTSLYAKAAGDGIRGNDGVILEESVTEVECEGTGIVSNSEKDMVIVQGGSCKIIAGENAISANRYVSIQNSRTDLYAVWESVKCDGIIELDEEVTE